MPMARLIITAVTVAGRTKSEVAHDYGLSRYWVQQLVQRYQREGPSAFQPGSRRPSHSPHAVDADTEEMIIRLRKELSKQGLDAGRQPAAPPAERCNAREPRGVCPRYAHSVSSGFPRWWRLGLTCTEVVLAAGLIVAAVTEGSWYWWAAAIAAATLALINLSVYLRTERERRRPPDP